MRILIVDDSRAMRSIVRRTLRQADLGDHEIEEAANGLEALKTIQQSAPDLVLCDVNMPQMSGMELLRALKKDGPNSKFGFVTSEAATELRDEALKSGALFVITKPFSPELFEETLAPILNGEGPEAASPAERGNGHAASAKPLLAPELVASLLRDLLGRAVIMKKCSPLAVAAKAPMVVAVYSAGQGVITCVCACDLAFAAQAGAALCMLPAASASEAVRAGRIEPAIEANLHEVFNVMSRLFDAPGATHASLSALHLPGAVLPADVVTLMSRPADRLDLEASITGYGAGKLTFLIGQKIA